VRLRHKKKSADLLGLYAERRLRHLARKRWTYTEGTSLEDLYKTYRSYRNLPLNLVSKMSIWQDKPKAASSSAPAARVCLPSLFLRRRPALFLSSHTPSPPAGPPSLKMIPPCTLHSSLLHIPLQIPISRSSILPRGTSMAVWAACTLPIKCCSLALVGGTGFPLELPLHLRRSRGMRGLQTIKRQSTSTLTVRWRQDNLRVSCKANRY
jgi:hypothetical protein